MPTQAEHSMDPTHTDAADNSKTDTWRLSMRVEPDMIVRGILPSAAFSDSLGPMCLSLIASTNSAVEDLTFHLSVENAEGETGDAVLEAFGSWLNPEGDVTSPARSSQGISRLKELISAKAKRFKNTINSFTAQRQTDSTFLSGDLGVLSEAREAFSAAQQKAGDAFISGDLGALSMANREALEAVIAAFGEGKFKIGSRAVDMPTVPSKARKRHLLEAYRSDDVGSAGGHSEGMSPVLRRILVVDKNGVAGITVEVGDIASDLPDPYPWQLVVTPSSELPAQAPNSSGWGSLGSELPSRVSQALEVVMGTEWGL